jgi:CheY-like chemotaxis protein
MLPRIDAPWPPAFTDSVAVWRSGHGPCTSMWTMPPQTRLVEARERRTGRQSDDAGAHQQPMLMAVDDDVATLDLLCEIAAEAGWFALGFTRLSPFRASLQREHPSLLIIDDDLPDGRGGDLARELREDPNTADVPLVVCTAAHPMRQAEIGAWAPVVSKPFDLGEIEQILAQVDRSRDGTTGRRSLGRAG